MYPSHWGLSETPFRNRVDPRFFHAVTRSWEIGVVPDRVTARLHIRPVGLDVLDDLIESGDLDPAVRERMPTFTLDGATLEWRQGVDEFGCVD